MTVYGKITIWVGRNLVGTRLSGEEIALLRNDIDPCRG